MIQCSFTSQSLSAILRRTNRNCICRCIVQDTLSWSPVVYCSTYLEVNLLFGLIIYSGRGPMFTEVPIAIRAFSYHLLIILNLSLVLKNSLHTEWNIIWKSPLGIHDLLAVFCWLCWSIPHRLDHSNVPWFSIDGRQTLGFSEAAATPKLKETNNKQ